MIGQKLLIKLVIGQVMKAIEKASDKRIASNHEKRICKLEELHIHKLILFVLNVVVKLKEK